MILDIAIGDAYGRAFEFNTKEFIKENNNGIDYCLRTDEDPELFGTYTDDTQMSIAIVEHLIYSPNNWTLDKIAEGFVKAYLRDPHLGYSKRITAAFMECDKKPQMGKRFFNACQTTAIINSNGSVMRSVPLGLLPSEGHVIRGAQMQSLITHCSPDASYGSQLIALTSHYFYYRKHNGDLSYEAYLKYLEQFNILDYYYVCEKNLLKHYKEHKSVPCDAQMTVAAVIYTLFKAKTTTDIIKIAVNFGGDVDSIASVALGLASIKDDIMINYSKELISNLENKKYGRDYLISLDKRLMQLYPRQ